MMLPVADAVVFELINVCVLVVLPTPIRVVNAGVSSGAISRHVGVPVPVALNPIQARGALRGPVAAKKAVDGVLSTGRDIKLALTPTPPVAATSILPI
jgi:hypothetical protein